MKRCFFAGHREIIDKDLEIKLTKAIIHMITHNNINEFMVSNYGMFDSLTASVVRKIKTQYPKIRLILVLPYLTKKITENKEHIYKNFDEIIMADIPYNTPMRFRILKMNEYMIKNSNALICYINLPFGGAWKTLELAQKKKMLIINLAKK